MTYEKAKCFPSLKKETDMVINEMGCRGSCVRKEKEVWKRRECLGNCKQFHAEGSLSCKKYVTWGEAGRNHTPEGHPPEPPESVDLAFTQSLCTLVTS